MQRSRWNVLGIFVVFALVLAGCTKPSEYAADAAGDGEQAAVAPATFEGIDADSRVVALSHTAGEVWLLAGGQLVGVTDEASDLQNLPEDIASLGEAAAVDAEAVAALDPDLVLLSADLPGHEELQQTLLESGLPAMTIGFDSFADYDALMSELTEKTGHEELYEKNVTNVKARIDDIVEHSAQPNRGSYVALCASASEGKVVPAPAFARAMLTDMGLTDALASAAPAEEVALEQVTKADPDWVFVVYEGDEAQAQKVFDEAMGADAAWSQLKAKQVGHVTSLPNALFYQAPCAKWSDAYAYLSQVLHGSWA